MFLDHTRRRSTVGRTPLDEWSARRRDLYLTTHDTHNSQISMPPVGFEPKISAGERPQAVLRSWVQIPPGARIFVCCECRVLSGRGLCDELITHPEESYRLCCVVVCDLETSRMGAPYIYDVSRLRVNIAYLCGFSWDWLQSRWLGFDCPHMMGYFPLAMMSFLALVFTQYHYNSKAWRGMQLNLLI